MVVWEIDMKNKEYLLFQENDRRRIAEELHDKTVQDMVCVSQKLELAMLYMDKDVARSRLEVAAARKQIRNAIDEIRDIIYDLRPMSFDDIGWTAACERLKDKLYAEKPDIDFCFEIDEIDTEDGIMAISIHRIISEACQNIIKHAKADHVLVSVKNKSNSIEIIIKDNGIGFDGDMEYNHFGLQFMKERVSMLSGKIDISSDLNGTSIHIVI